MQQTDHLRDTSTKKPYARPAVVHELTLETRAGSPITGSPDVLDPLGLGSDD